MTCRTGPNGRDGLTWKDVFLINEQTENIRQWYSFPRSLLRAGGEEVIRGPLKQLRGRLPVI